VFLFLLANLLLGNFFDNREFWGFALLLLAAPVAVRSQRRITDPYEATVPSPERAHPGRRRHLRDMSVKREGAA
jgi:hypothetical protein